MRKNITKKMLACGLVLVMGMGMLTGCGGSKEEAKNDSAATEETVNVDAKLSAEDYDLQTDYYFKDFNDHTLADVPRQGVITYEKKDEVIYDDLTYEEFIDMLDSEGTYIFTLAGSWCHNSRAMTPTLNKLAKEYGIDTIYTYDFDLDNKEDGNTFVRMTDGSGNAGVNFNYMYGEVIQRYLTNMDDWIQFPSTTEAAITYTNAKGKANTIARAQQPIVVVYNKDNTQDNSNAGNGTKKCPVVYAFEQMVDRDADGVYTIEYDKDGKEKTDDDGNVIKNYITEQYEADMKVMFDLIKDNNVKFDTYSKEDFVRKAFPSLKDAKKVNVKTITYRQYAWLLQQDGSAIYMVGGTYDKATQKAIADVNAKAVEAGVNVYLFDPNVDNGICENEWGYKNTGDITKSETIGFMNENLISDSLTNLDADTKLPYVFAYNKAATDEDGISAPVMATSAGAKDMDAVIDAYNAPIE